MQNDRGDISSYKHGMAELEPGLRLHYVEAGDGERIVVLLHGFPQTWWEWRRIIPSLVRAGYRVIAPDYRGAGNSSRPLSGYDKRTIATDINALLKEHLKVTTPVRMVGHDIGLMVAYAFTQTYRDSVSHLVVMDAPLPGTTVFDRLRSDPRVWHFAFHGARDIPEMLVAGHEREYIKSFFDARILNPAAFSEEDLNIYASAYRAPGAMRAGFELYRAFDQDAADNRAALNHNGKLKIPVLAMFGALSNTGSGVEEMMREVADDVTGMRVPDAGHWIAEENPEFLISRLLSFFDVGWNL
jgi:pimeloyl-ACP methyl ester carboxylesterase